MKAINNDCHLHVITVDSVDKYPTMIMYLNDKALEEYNAEVTKQLTSLYGKLTRKRDQF